MFEKRLSASQANSLAKLHKNPDFTPTHLNNTASLRRHFAENTNFALRKVAVSQLFCPKKPFPAPTAPGAASTRAVRFAASALRACFACVAFCK